MRGWFRGSLPLRVLFATVVIFALPLLIYFLVVFYQSFQRRYDEVVGQLRDLGESRAMLLTQAKNFSLRTIDVVENLMTEENLDTLFDSVTKGGDFSSAFFIKEEQDGKYLITASSNPSIIGENFTGQALVEQAKAFDSVAFLDFDESSFQRLLWVVKEVDNPPGLLVVTTPVLNLLGRLVGEAPYSVNFSLIDRQNVVFASSNPNLALKTIEDPQEVMTFEEGGKTFLAVRVPIKETSLALLVDVNEKQALGGRLDRLWHVLIIFFILVVIGGGVALWITRRMSKPLNQLIGVMHQVSGGDLTARFKKDPAGFEINTLGGIFNETIDSLSDHMEKAEVERIHRETLAKELAIGKEIQLAILPQERPEFSGVNIAARYLPAKEVGGDFYDAFATGENLVLTVADASGKGIPACLYSLSLRGILRACCQAYEDHATIVREANNLFCKDTGMSGMFVTAFVAIYHPDNQTLTYCSLGHPPAFLLRQNGTIERLSSGGLPMGIQELPYVEAACTALKPGDTLFLYTDGITEAHNPHDELYGDERLFAYLQSAEGPPERLIDGLLHSVESFRGTAAQFDDITLMAIKIEG